jgi:small subunit ribosomal protein S4
MALSKEVKSQTTDLIFSNFIQIKTMSRYTGPKVRIVRRLGLLPGLTRKDMKNRERTPGQHGKVVMMKPRRATISQDYKDRLLEKQKLRFNYGVSEKQLVAYYKEAKNGTAATGNSLLELLESRLDCIVFRLGFAPSIPAARQIISHGHILVNNRLVDIASFQCKKGDTIRIKERESSKKLILGNFTAQQEKRTMIARRMKRVKFFRSPSSSLLPKHLELNTENQVVGKVLSVVNRKDVLVSINELKVVEYYSR